MNKTWFIADTHFGHTAILKYEDRPWENTDQMDTALINNWNETVSDEDVIWHLGDVALTTKPRILQILAQLKGHKHLVCGNHDRGRTCTWWRNHGFESAVKYPQTVELILKQPGRGFIPGGPIVTLSHVPVPNTEILNIHGHMHANKYRTMSDGDPALYRCVSVEQTGFRPVSLEELL